MRANGLRRADLEAVLNATECCAGASTMQEFAKRVVAGLQTLVSCDVASYDEVHLEDGRSWGYTAPAGVASKDATQVLAEYGRENPLIRLAIETPHETPRSWSELENASQMHSTNLYNLLYRRIGLEDHLAAILPSGSPGVAVGAVAGRSTPGFSDRDRLVMDIYRRQLGPLRHLIMTSDRLRRALACSPMAVLGVDSSGVIRSVCDDLSDVTGSDSVPRVGNRMADPVDSWLQTCRTSPEPAADVRTFGELWYRFVPGETEDLVVVGRAAPDASRESGWLVGVMGGFRLVGPAGPVAIGGKPAELVKLLAVAGGILPADEVIESLWPEVDPEVGHRRLRVVLHRVPHQPSPLVVRRGDALALDSRVTVDLRTFEEGASAAMAATRRRDASAVSLVEGALSHYRADLLPEDTYRDWATGPRERLRRQRLELLDVLAADAEARGDVDRSVSLLSQAIEADPVDETRRVRLGWLLLGARRRSAAVCVVRAAEELARDLGLGVSPELAALRAAARG